MATASTAGILLVAILGCLLSAAEGYTCSYYDVWNVRHNVYCTYYDNCCGTSTYRYCCNYTSPGTIVGSLFGSLVFIAIVVSIILCCCCNCCPVYRYRTQGTVITTSQPGPNYQTIPNTGNPVNAEPYMAKPAGAYTGPPSYQA